MKVIKYTDPELVDLIRNGGKDLEIAFAFLLHNERRYHSIRKLIFRLGGRQEQYEEIFDDALIALHTAVKCGRYQNRFTINAYLHGIARNLWYKRWAKQKIKTVSMSTLSNHEIPSVESHLITEERSEVLRDVMKHLGERCKNILIKSLLEGYKNTELVEILNYKNEGVVRKTKSQCVKKLIALLKEKPQLIKNLI